MIKFHMTDIFMEKKITPTVGRANHYSIYLEWSHVKEHLTTPANKRLKFRLQQYAHPPNDNDIKEWTNVYTGFGVCTTATGLEPLKDYSYRLMVQSPHDYKKYCSEPIRVKTTKEPINCEMFHKAVFFDKRSEVDLFLEQGNRKELLETPDRMGYTALMIAVLRDHLELIDILIDVHGAQVDFQNESLKTAMMIAAFHGKLQFVKVLRQYNASYEIRENSGMTALHYAVDGGHCDTIEYMIMDGADPNAIETRNGWTPLLRAASLNAKAEVALVLVKYGAHLNVEDFNNKTALMTATINGNIDFVKALVNSGADMYILTEDGRTLYDLAQAMDRRLVCKFFDELADKNKEKVQKSRPSILNFDSFK